MSNDKLWKGRIYCYVMSSIKFRAFRYLGLIMDV